MVVWLKCARIRAHYTLRGQSIHACPRVSLSSLRTCLRFPSWLLYQTKSPLTVYSHSFYRLGLRWFVQPAPCPFRRKTKHPSLSDLSSPCTGVQVSHCLHSVLFTSFGLLSGSAFTLYEFLSAPFSRDFVPRSDCPRGVPASPLLDRILPGCFLHAGIYVSYIYTLSGVQLLFVPSTARPVGASFLPPFLLCFLSLSIRRRSYRFGSILRISSELIGRCFFCSFSHATSHLYDTGRGCMSKEVDHQRQIALMQ